MLTATTAATTSRNTIRSIRTIQTFISFNPIFGYLVQHTIRCGRSTQTTITSGDTIITALTRIAAGATTSASATGRINSTIETSLGTKATVTTFTSRSTRRESSSTTSARRIDIASTITTITPITTICCSNSRSTIGPIRTPTRFNGVLQQ